MRRCNQSRYFKLWVLLLTLMVSSYSAQASLFDKLGGSDGPLDVDDAYHFSAVESSPGIYRLSWDIEDDYYLYRDKIKVKPSEKVEVVGSTYSDSEEKDDPLFGKVQVYYKQANVDLQLKSLQPGAVDETLKIEYQGCWDGGICYPPVTKEIVVKQVPATLISVVESAPTGSDNSSLSLTDQRQFINALSSGNLLLTLGLFFVAGLALSLTPCVFPMVPILAGVIAGQKGCTSKRAFWLSVVYVLAMSVTYTVAGIIAGLFGENLQAAFQNPWIISSFSLLFVVFSGAMFGFYQFEMPVSVQNRLNRMSRSQQGGDLAGVAMMGFLSALIVGPCVAAPLAGALIFIGQTGDPLLGGSALFVLSLGMGLPLILIGTTAGKLMPKAGAWMNTVKAIFGVVMLLMAVWMLDRIVPATVTMVLLGVILVVSAIYLRALDSLSDSAHGLQRLGKGVGILLLIYGGSLLVGAAGGNQSVVYPLKGVIGSGTAGAATQQLPTFTKVTSYNALEPLLAASKKQNRPVLLDFYADWCVSCKELEFYTFADKAVQQQMDRFTLVKVDVTANDQAAKDLYKRYKIVGPPALVFYDQGGALLNEKMLVGVPTPQEFVNHLKKIDS
ncbi:MAG: protein-disulfide reductase DsbD [Motiliproteus sp.]|nr:protein-disulfide reductase DsbD [Motiliproteus sp.]MCW9052968.1 protein-disulfide reductase DsbD [Motiliproteus sp.]